MKLSFASHIISTYFGHCYAAGINLVYNPNAVVEYIDEGKNKLYKKHS